MSSFVVRKESKKTKQVQDVDIRPRLLALELLPPTARTELADYAKDILAAAMAEAAVGEGHVHVLRYTSDIDGGNIGIQPHRVLELLSAAMELEAGALEVIHIHRTGITLAAPAAVPPDMKALRRMVRWDGFAGHAMRYGSGPWSTGLENRPGYWDAASQQWELQAESSTKQHPQGIPYYHESD